MTFTVACAEQHQHVGRSVLRVTSQATNLRSDQTLLLEPR